ncbi:MAG: pirin family protein, partial [Flavobacteriales bacterium]
WDKQHEEIYHLHGSGQGIYVFLLEGELSVDGRMMNRRDGMGVSGKSSIQLKAQEDSKVLLIEIPMKW